MPAARRVAEVAVSRLLEELSLNAWPALYTLAVDGWIARLAAGYTRRANAVYPLADGEGDVETRIADCERLYARHGQPCVFKMTEAARPAGLDTLLDRRGYVEWGSPSHVMTADITASAPPGDTHATIEPALSDAWRDLYCTLNHIDPRHAPTMTRMLNSIALPHVFVTILRDEAPVAMGLGVVERGWLALFDIVTAEAYRGRGYGTELLRHLFVWARTQGAERCYLQVVSDNTAAQRLYGKLGFERAYTYWYRVQGDEQA